MCDADEFFKVLREAGEHLIDADSLDFDVSYYEKRIEEAGSEIGEEGLTDLGWEYAEKGEEPKALGGLIDGVESLVRIFSNGDYQIITPDG